MSEPIADALEPHTNGRRRDDEKGDRYPQKRLQSAAVGLSMSFQSSNPKSKQVSSTEWRTSHRCLSARQPAAIS